MAKSNKAPVTASIPALAKHVTAIKAAYVKRESFNINIGKAVIEAAQAIEENQIEAFIGMVKTSVLTTGVVSEGSLKVELTRMRGVIKAIVTGGFEPEENTSLRAMYDAIPKNGVGGAPKKGAKLPNPGKGESEEPGKLVTLTGAEKRAMDINAAITTLFGTCNAELVGAVEYAVSHSGVFMSWAAASAKAGKLAEMEKALDTVKPVPAKKAPAKRKAAATA